MEIQPLKEWNPWWADEPFADLEGKPRPAYQDLIGSSGVREITIITGVRRSGKSTLMYQMAHNLLQAGVKPEQILFVNLEDKKLGSYTLEDIYVAYRSSLNAEQKAYLFLDEVHKREGWESWIRKKYDLKTPDKFVISGSSSYLLKKEYSTLLTGRNLTFDVFPLSFREFLFFHDIRPGKVILDKIKYKILKLLPLYVRHGGYPEIFFKQERYKTRLLAQYFDDILYKDIIDRYNLNSQKVKDLALLLMATIAGQISLRKVRAALGLSYDTTKEYLSYFREAFLFFTLDHFSYSYKEQKTLPSKAYCIDTGLRNAVSFSFSTDEGKLIENMIFIELKRREKDTYYWKGGGEVDFVVKNPDQSLTAINVTCSDRIPERETTALLEFRKEFDKTRELVLITKDIEKQESGIRFVPLWKWLLE